MTCPAGFHQETIIDINGNEICFCAPNNPSTDTTCPTGFSPQTVIDADGNEVCICVYDPINENCDVSAYFDYQIIGFRLYANGVFNSIDGAAATSYTVNLWSEGKDPAVDTPNYTFDQSAFPLGGWIDDDGDPITPPIPVTPPTGLPLTMGQWTIIVSDILFGNCPAEIAPITTPKVEAADCCAPITYTGAGSGQSSGIQFSIQPGATAGNVYVDLGTCVVVDKVNVYDQFGNLIGSTPYVGTVVPIAPTEQGFGTNVGIYPNLSIAGQPQSARDNLIPPFSLAGVTEPCVLSSLTGQWRLTVPYDPAIHGDTLTVEVTGNNLAFTVWGVNVICVGEDCDPCSTEIAIEIEECFGKHYVHGRQEVVSGSTLYLGTITHTLDGITTTYTPTTPIETTDIAAMISYVSSLPSILFVRFIILGRGVFEYIGECDANVSLSFTTVDAAGNTIAGGAPTTELINAAGVATYNPTYTPPPIKITASSTVGLDSFTWVLGNDLVLVSGALTDMSIEVMPQIVSNPDYSISATYGVSGCQATNNVTIDLCDKPNVYIFPEWMVLSDNDAANGISKFTISNGANTLVFYFSNYGNGEYPNPAPQRTLQGLADWLNTGDFMAVDGVSGMWQAVQGTGLVFTTYQTVPETPNQGWILIVGDIDLEMPFKLYKTAGEAILDCDVCTATINLDYEVLSTGNNSTTYRITATLSNGLLTVNGYNWNFPFPHQIQVGTGNSQSVVVEMFGANATGSVSVSVAQCANAITRAVNLPPQ
jgi:hypothetical protein